MKQLLILPLVAGVLVTGCAPKPGAEKNLAIDPSNMDTTVACGEDFYEYACGGWIKKNPLKPEYARYGSFDVLAENNQKQMRELIDELEKAENEPGSVAQKVGDLYKMGCQKIIKEYENKWMIKLLLHLSLLKCIKKDHLLSFNYM